MAGGMLAAGTLIAGLWSARTPEALSAPTAAPLMFATTPSTGADLPAPTVTPTAGPTITPYPTIALSPSPTLSDTDRLRLDGGLFLTGALTEEQQLKLYEASIKYIARTPQDGRLVAQQINGVEYGYADNTCGPLSMAILRDAGLISPDVVPHDFWLLNPWLAEDRRFLIETLSPERFEHLEFHGWMKDFDWKAYPLLPGDFVYIHAGGGGNFDHMLVVNRVDGWLRAYSVTNYQRPDGFVIDEVLLYDPRDPHVGILDAWSGRAQAPSGSTGFGGFEIWRPRRGALW